MIDPVSNSGSLGPVNDLPALGIRRPWLVAVINLLIVIAGIAAFGAIEVRELPNVDRPVVSVRATLPGASPETMDAEVASILEGAVARVSGVSDIRSSSEENSVRIRAEFNPNVDLEVAAADMREAVSQVVRRLPERVEDVQVVKSDQDSRAIVQIAATSDVLTETELASLLEKDIVPELISIKGVADVRLFGNRQRQLRVVIDPLKLTGYGLNVDDVASVLRNAPLDVPAGSFRSVEQELIVRADASAVTEKQISNITLRGPVRVGDVAQVFFGPADATSYTLLDGRTVIGIGVVRQAQSNTIQISDDVLASLDRIRSRFPHVNLIVTDDSALFIRGSVEEVVKALVMTVVVVMATLMLFLGSFRTALVPGVAIPVALVGTIAGIWILGFTINILTLLALVLATGLIVDDAIIVVENIQRMRSEGVKRRAAAVLGTRQVFFAVIATTAVLVSVFIPISFLPSTAGKLFQEFGFVLATAVCISSFVALSLVPSLSARLPDNIGSKNTLWRGLSSLGRKASRFYAGIVAHLVRSPWLSLAGALSVALVAASLYRDLQNELVPPEDRGIIYVTGSGPDGVGLRYAERQTAHLEAILQPYVDSGEAKGLFTIIGRFDPNRVWITIPLAPWSERSRNAQTILNEIRPQLTTIPGMQAFAFSSNSLNVRGGSSSGGDLDFALLGSDYAEIFAAARSFSGVLADQSSILERAQINYRPSQPQLSVTVDRLKAADLGVPLEGLAQTLRAMINGERVVDLSIADENIPVIIESSSGTINDPNDLINLYVRTNTATLVPLSSLVTFKEEGVAAQLDRRAQRRSIGMQAAIAEGYTVADALEEALILGQQHLPSGISILPLGEAATLQETSSEVMMTYAIALLVVFLVLIAQFESFTSALVVMITVPFGIVSAVFALWITGVSINIYSQIGLVMLIGLMAKNGILLVEFADQMRDQGLSVLAAIEEAAKVRLRPVMMTLVSTVFGGLPLVLSTGAGAEARISIGWVIFGGLGCAALFTLFLTPVVYRLVAPLSKARAEEGKSLEDELTRANSLQSEGRAELSTETKDAL